MASPPGRARRPRTRLRGVVTIAPPRPGCLAGTIAGGAGTALKRILKQPSPRAAVRAGQSAGCFSQTETCYRLSAHERLAGPLASGPAAHPGELGHQVELGRPDVAERIGRNRRAVDDREVVRYRPCQGRPRRTRSNRQCPLAEVGTRAACSPGGSPPGSGIMTSIDEAAAGLEVRRHVAEAGDLPRPGSSRPMIVLNTRYARENGPSARSWRSRRWSRRWPAARLGPQSRRRSPATARCRAPARRGADKNAAGDAPGADAELERPPVAREPGEEVDGGGSTTPGGPCATRTGRRSGRRPPRRRTRRCQSPADGNPGAGQDAPGFPERAQSPGHLPPAVTLTLVPGPALKRLLARVRKAGQAPCGPADGRSSRRRSAQAEVQVGDELGDVHLGLLQAAGVVPVHRLPAGELVENPHARTGGCRCPTCRCRRTAGAPRRPRWSC